MKLLFAIKNLTVEGGGAERVLATLANAFAARGHTVETVTLDAPFERAFYDFDPSIYHHTLNLCPDIRSLPREKLPQVITGLRRLVRHGGYDAALGFMHSMFVPLSVGLVGTGVPMIACEHTTLTHYDKRPVQRAMLFGALRLCSAMTVVTEDIYEEFPPSRRGKLLVKYNPLDLSSFEAARALKGDGPPTVLMVGRLKEAKRPLDLVDAFAMISAKFPDWRLRFVGDGDQRQKVEARVREHGLDHRVSMPGTVREPALEYGRADIVAMPTLYEASPMVAAEANAAALPVIGFEGCPGVSTLIKQEINGLLMPNNGDRPTEMARGLERLMRDDILRKRLGDAGPAEVEKFAVSRVVDDWELFITEIVERKFGRG